MRDVDVELLIVLEVLRDSEVVANPEYYLDADPDGVANRDDDVVDVADRERDFVCEEDLDRRALNDGLFEWEGATATASGRRISRGFSCQQTKG